MRKSNIWTIVSKEFARFFGDRSLFFTTVLMPGLLIYIIYSLMGTGISEMESVDDDVLVKVYTERLPMSMAHVFDSLPGNAVVLEAADSAESIVNSIASKDEHSLLVSFPVDFDSLVAVYDPLSGEFAPNIAIYHNSANPTTESVYVFIESMLNAIETNMCNMYDINRSDGTATFNKASGTEELGSILSSLIPMLILMLIFSACMSIAPSTIAGEKERGTIATLLVTPMKRSHLAIGKIISLSCFALLSGISSFLGIVLSFPKMIMSTGGEDDETMSALLDAIGYTLGDYGLMLLMVMATTLIMVSAISLLSALAKDVKSAGTIVTPFMFVIMFVGLLPMLSGDNPTEWYYGLIPFYNSVLGLSSIFAYDINPLNFIVIIGSNILYTFVAVWLLTKMFNSEKVMFGK